MMVNEAISHEKVRDEMDKYIAKMKATGFRLDATSYGSSNPFIELLRWVVYVEQYNYEQSIEPKKVLKEIGEEE